MDPLYNAKLLGYDALVTVIRKGLLALLAALLVLAFSEGLLWAQGVHWLVWPVMILRGALLATIAPALAVRFWLGLHTGLDVPTMLLVWPLLLFYWQLWSVGKTMWASLSAPARPGRRAFLAVGGVAALSGCGAVHAYPAPEITRITLPLKDLPRTLGGRRLVLLSDLHRGPAMSREYLESVVHTVNGFKPDLVLLPGDFVSHSSVYFSDVTAILRQLRPRIASVATLGNHDHWEGTEEAKRCLRDAGVLLLDNSSLHLEEDGGLTSCGDRGLCLVGVDDLIAGNPDLCAALSGVPAGVPRILLSHNPDLAEEEQALKSGIRIDLQVSGHTHGGQIVLPGAGPVVSGSRYGLKYLSGWVEGPSWPVFVTRGVGAGVIPLRVGAPPEIVVFDLTCAISAPHRVA